MISLSKISLVVLPALALSTACSESATEPPGSDAVINLATSGGFAGVDFAFSVDGPLGVIRGLRCASFCDWEEGDVLVEVSSAEVAELESKFDAVDFLAGEDEDFGEECCDQFHYELTFIRGDASRTVMGSSEKLPANVAALIREIEQWVDAKREAEEGLDDQRDLIQNHDDWTALGITDYTFTFTRTCFCPVELFRPAEVVVRAGLIESVTYLDDGQPVDAGILPSYQTIDELFEMIADAIARDAVTVDVTYDADLHYPTDGYIDISEQIADEEQGFTATDLVPLQGS